MNSDVKVHRVPGAPHILVDGFKHIKPGISCVVLTHAHADHTTGLAEAVKRGWPPGLRVVCTPITKRLVEHKHGVDGAVVTPLDLEATTDVGGVKVTFLDAHHCPGAAMVVFNVDGVYHLHCGDMKHVSGNSVHGMLSSVTIDTLFLDTTYAHKRHVLPLPSEACAQVATTVAALPEDTLVCIGAYTIGKEAVLMAASDAMEGCNICIPESKVALLECTGTIPPTRFTTDPTSTRLHCVAMSVGGELWPYFRVDYQSVVTYMESVLVAGGEAQRRYPACVVFLPTGWAGSGFNSKHSKWVSSKPVPCVCGGEDTGGVNITVHLVAYTEHSDYPGLQDFVRQVRPRRVVPTVGNTKESQRICKEFDKFCDKAAGVKAFLSGFGVAAPRAQEPREAAVAPKPRVPTAGAGRAAAPADVVDLTADDDEVATVETPPSKRQRGLKSFFGSKTV